MAHVQVHRFMDGVAVITNKGETCYLTADDAQGLAVALNAAALDVEKRSLAGSRFRTWWRDCPDARQLPDRCSTTRRIVEG